MDFKTYIRNRFYFRGATWLGVLNTVLACLCNRVLVKHIDVDTQKIVGWSVKRGTDFPPEGHLEWPKTLMNLCTGCANFFSGIGDRFWKLSVALAVVAVGAETHAKLYKKHTTLDPDELARLRRIADLARLFVVNSGNVIFTSENAHFDALREEVIAQMEAERAAH